MSSDHPRLDSARLRALYHTMLRIRRFEEAVADAVEAGEIKTPCHLCIGQEAPAAGVCAALAPDDYIWGAHRSHGHYLAKGGDLRSLMAEILCRATGCSGGRGGSMHVCDPERGIMGTVPIVAATIPLAVGAALAESLRGGTRVSVSFFGDGATEEGHFHESLNIAALRGLPVLFVCENNLYASHMGLLERRVQDQLIEFGRAHGVTSASVDGNDVEAVFHAAAEACGRARRGDGPTLIECRTFRWRGHVGPSWDLDVGVQRKDELREWLTKDPLPRCAERLGQLGVPASELERIAAVVQAEIAAALTDARQAPVPHATTLHCNVFRAA